MHSELDKRYRRDNDGLLHASSHLNGSLRHAQLDVAGAPKHENDAISEITLATGRMWHLWIHDTLRDLGVPYMAEVNLTPWMPVGWGGTADAVVWNPELKAFVLVDFKTQKGEGMRYILRDGAKEDHRKQTSLYWHALKKMGIPLAKTIGMFYLPKNNTRNKDEVIEPVLIDFEPIPARELHAEAKRRTKRTTEYIASLPLYGLQDTGTRQPILPTEAWLTDALEPGPVREQRIYFDRATDTWDVKLVAPWYADYCSYGELCSCGDLGGTTKIGQYDVDGLTYYARKGYEEIEPIVRP